MAHGEIEPRSVQCPHCGTTVYVSLASWVRWLVVFCQVCHRPLLIEQTEDRELITYAMLPFRPPSGMDLSHDVLILPWFWGEILERAPFVMEQPKGGSPLLPDEPDTGIVYI